MSPKQKHKFRHDMKAFVGSEKRHWGSQCPVFYKHLNRRRELFERFYLAKNNVNIPINRAKMKGLNRQQSEDIALTSWNLS